MKDKENLSRDLVGFGMSYEDFKTLCRLTCEDFIYFYFERSQKNNGKHTIQKENKNHDIESKPETKLFREIENVLFI